MSPRPIPNFLNIPDDAESPGLAVAGLSADSLGAASALAAASPVARSEGNKIITSSENCLFPFLRSSSNLSLRTFCRLFCPFCNISCTV